MKLNLNELECKAYASLDVLQPQFNIENIKKNTEERPVWLHFGAGNIFRGYIAKINQSILNHGEGDTGIVAVESFDYEIIDKIYEPYDNLTLLVGLSADQPSKIEIISGVSRAYKANPIFSEYSSIIDIVQNPSLQMVSFTITEKGYGLRDTNQQYLSMVQEDIKKGPNGSINHVISIVTSLLYKRYQKGKYPLALCSMDNCSHNGEKLRNGILDIAKEWMKLSHVSLGFIDYLQNEDKITFPWSMIDKITPRPSKEIQEKLSDLGWEGMDAILTSKGTYIAPFVNAEKVEYLVIEDKFPNGRPKLELGGVHMTDRETVNKVETMKVTTCLNPLHTALAVYGCILGYTRIYEEMKNPLLRKLVEKIGYEEGMPVVIDPKIIQPQKFIDEVIYKRLTNPYIPDEPQRIATDTSQKVGIRYGETIKSYISHETLDVQNLTYIPLAIAGWFRYLLAVDDHGNSYTLSSDPLLDELSKYLKDIRLGSIYRGEIKQILSNTSIFNVDLVECGLSDKIEKMFTELIAGKNAVRITLEKYLND